MIKRILISGVLIAAGFLGGCVDDTPLQLDNMLVDLEEITISPPVLEVTAAKEANTGSGASLYVGQADGKLVSSLIKFTTFPDSVLSLESAELVMISVRTLGDTVGEFRASVHRVTAAWEELEVTMSSFAGAFDASEMGGATIAAADTDTVRIALDPAMVLPWLRNPDDNHGIYIRTDAAPILKQFNSLNAASDPPRLEIAYRDSSDSDSLRTAESFATADAFIFETLQAPEEGPVYVSNGLEARTLLKFDLSAIPDDVTINHAELKLTLDLEHSYLDSLSGFPFDLYQVTEETTDPHTAAFDSLRSLNPRAAVALDTTQTLTIVFSETNRISQIQRWAFGLDQNYGFVLIARRPYQDLFRVAFFTAAMDSAKAPELVIRYTPNSENQ